MEKQLVAAKGNRTPASKRVLPSRKSTLSSTPLDIFAALRARRMAWTVPEQAVPLSVSRCTVYQAATTGQRSPQEAA